MKKLLFAIAGSDGSGKATQTKLLEQAFRAQGHEVLHQEFPRYGDGSAYVTEQYLGGAYGKQPPEIASVFYTVDRFDKLKTEIEPFFASHQTSLFHKIIVFDRWVDANKIHQVGKGKTPAQREEIRQYIDNLEHTIMGLPRATQTIYLDCHPLLGQRLSGIGKNSKIEGKDLHEGDIHHLLDARRAGIEVVEKENWVYINSMRKPVDSYSKEELLEKSIENLLRSREDIHQEVYNSIQKYL